MTRLAQLITGAGGLLGLLALLFGAPTALVIVAGWPLPDQVPTWHVVTETLNRQMTFTEVTAVLAVLGWFLWLQFAWCVCVEAVAQLRQHADANRVRFASGSQALARSLVLATIMLVATMHRATPAPVVQTPMVPAVAIHEQAADEQATAAEHSAVESIKNAGQQDGVALPVVTVVPRDDLWGLAQKHLGNPTRWREIFDLNQGLAQQDGRALTRSDLIRPGWQLQLPADAGDVDAPAPNTSAEPAAGDANSAAAVADSPTVEAATSTLPSTTTTTAQSATTTPSTTFAASSPDVPGASEPVNASAADDGATSRSSFRGIFSIGLTAAGVVALLEALRRRQLRRRLVGKRIPMPDEHTAKAELALRVAADHSGADRLSDTLRALAACLQQRTESLDNVTISAVRVDGKSIEVLFDEAVDAPPGPFEIDRSGRAWTLNASITDVSLGALATRMAAPVPGLVSVGKVDDATVLIDIEGHGLTTVSGEANAIALFDTMALELATNVWADDLRIVAVGEFPAIADAPRVHHVGAISDVIDELRHDASVSTTSLKRVEAGSTLAARLAPESSEGWVPTVVLCRSTDIEDFGALVAIAADGRQGVCVLALGVSDLATRTIITSGESVSVTPPGVVVDAPALQAEDIDAISRVLAVAHDQSAGEPYELPADIDLREPATAIAERDDSSASVTAPHGVIINVLGRVEISGNAKPFTRRKPLELVAYLALHANPVSSDRLKTALWLEREPTGGTFHTTVTSARSALGVDSSDLPYLLPSVGSLYELSDAVTSDFTMFRRLVSAAREQSTADTIDTLSAALRLVRGTPFEDAKGYEWIYTDGIVSEMQAVIADTAHQLATLLIDVDNGQQATWAARQGLLVAPADEALYRDLMRAAAQQGQLSTVKTLMNELCRVLDVDPDDGLQAETEALYRQLMQGEREDAQ